MAMQLIEQAQAGDGDAFRELVDPYRRELQVHCYRMLGSLHDAEDALQETLLAAWQGLGGFEGRSSLRTWLYRVATNRCLNMVRSTARRPQAGWPVPDVEPIEANRLGEVVWLEPYPDTLLEGLPASPPGPEARYASNETISLAFITALQMLPPRQRAVLVLRDVLGFHADEVAETLQTTLDSVTSALKRARAAVNRRMESSVAHEPPPAPNSPEEAALVARLARAYETGDIDGLIALLTDDVLVAMPPVPLEYQGIELVRRFHTEVTFRNGRRWHVVPTRANGQPAFGAYLKDPDGGPSHALGLLTVTLAGDRISAITRFDLSVLPHFGFPRSLPS